MVRQVERVCQEKSYAENDESEEYRVRRIHSFIKASGHLLKSDANEIMTIVNFLKNYLDKPILDEIEGTADRLKFLGGATTFSPYQKEAAHEWLSLVSNTKIEFDKLLPKIEALITENKKI